MNQTDLPRFLRHAEFKQQLNVVVTVGVVFFALFSSLLTSWQGSRQIRDTLVNQGGQIAESLARQSGLALLYESPDNARDIVKTTLAFPNVQRVEILHADGSVLVASGKDDTAISATLDRTARAAYLEADSGETWRFVAPVLAKAVASQFDDADNKEELLGFVRVLQSKETLSRMLVRIFTTNLAISLLFALVLLVVLRQLANRLTRPIMALSATMACAERGDLTVRAGLVGPKDIVDMATAFNSMIGSLQDRERLAQQIRAIEAAHLEARIVAERDHAEREHQRRVLAMLTHELKTPLSVIRMRLGTAQPSPRMQAHASNAISDIDAIVERVALATRIEDQSVKKQLQDCRLDELLAELGAQQTQPARVVLDLPTDASALRLTTDPLLLRTALGNLLDNALKYAPAAAAVHIGVKTHTEADPPGVIIRIENPVGSTGRPDPSRIFEKYYRAPGAHNQSGSGLGLYIVQELAELLEGRIRYLTEHPNVCFELWLPLTPAL